MNEKMTHIPARLRAFALLLLVLVFTASCASFGPTSPNVSIISPEYERPADTNFAEAQSILKDIASQNDLLARELGKLPEVQDGVNQDDLEALRVIRNVYQEHPKAFDAAFAEMYKVGKPEVRRYCSPLQALYWLAEDDRFGGEKKSMTIEVAAPQWNNAASVNTGTFSVHKSIVRMDIDGNTLDLETLLKEAWRYDNLILTKEEINDVIDSLKDSSDVKMYRRMQKRCNDAKLQNYLYEDLEKHPSMFSTRGHTILKRAASKSRWNDFNTVIERLNSPYLLDIYINSEITYVRNYGRTKNPVYVFKNKTGDCDDLALFGKKILDRAGYQTLARRLNNGSRDAHIGLVLRTEQGGYFLVIDFLPRGNRMAGPFSSLLEVDQTLGYGTRYRQRESKIFRN